MTVNRNTYQRGNQTDAFNKHVPENTSSKLPNLNITPLGAVCYLFDMPLTIEK